MLQVLLRNDIIEQQQERHRWEPHQHHVHDARRLSINVHRYMIVILSIRHMIHDTKVHGITEAMVKNSLTSNDENKISAMAMATKLVQVYLCYMCYCKLFST